MNEEGKVVVHRPLMEQLEASFWGNVSHCFVPTQFERKFNHCLLSELKVYIEDKMKLSKRDGFTFSCTYYGSKERVIS